MKINKSKKRLKNKLELNIIYKKDRQAKLYITTKIYQVDYITY